MSDRSNEPPATDHDRLIEMSATLRHVEDEVVGLRNWRHDVVAPVMTAIQSQQRANADHIGRLAESVDKLTLAIAPLAVLPGEFLQHQDRDDRAFLDLNRQFDAVHEKFDAHSKEVQKGQWAIIRWIATIVGFALTAVIGAQWAILQAHLFWK